MAENVHVENSSPALRPVRDASAAGASATFSAAFAWQLLPGAKVRGSLSLEQESEFGARDGIVVFGEQERRQVSLLFPTADNR